MFYHTYFSLTLEDIKQDKCKISIRLEDVKTQIIDATKFEIKLKRRNGKCDLISSNNISKNSGEDGTKMYFILKDLELKTGSEYQFILEIKDNDEKHESEYFDLPKGINTISLCIIIVYDTFYIDPGEEGER